MKKIMIFTLFSFLGLMTYAQMPELTVEQHLEDYDFAVKYIEDNYSGFPDKVNNGTFTEYDSMKLRLRTQVLQGERPGWDAVAEYTAWFNDRHLKIHLAYYNDKNEYIGYTEHYSKKKVIHYEAEMEYKPVAIACKVTDKTFLIRFPSCDDDRSNIKWIKNSIKQFKKSHCENLIIDIRDNGGGDPRWKPYWKLLYDHEGIVPGCEYRNTAQNMAYIKEVGWRNADFLEKMSTKNPESEFIGGGYPLIKSNKVDKTVKKAAIIIDNGVASNGEAMVLEIKATSYRTTIYGRDNTIGCLDYSNVAIIPFKHFDHYFGVPMTRRLGLPATGIDATGIAPDVRIDLPLPAKLTDNIDEWVIWVAEQLEK
ncbi:MAG: peptidase S41 [Muribaculaceae bacterium]|nr:peptidase S41 [Muribaculaceae bacterium]